jgi:hypothetical protein
MNAGTRFWIAIFAVCLLAGCSLEPPQPQPEPAATPVPVQNVAAPGGAARIPPGTCQVTAAQAAFRRGPSPAHETIVTLQKGDQIQVAARNAQASFIEGTFEGVLGWAETASLDCGQEILTIAIEPNIPTEPAGAPVAVDEPTQGPPATLVIPPTVAPPDRPQNASCAVISDTQIRVTWVDVSGSETEYRVSRAVPGGYWEDVAILPTDTLGKNIPMQFVDAYVTPGIPHTYQVIAFRATDGASSPPSDQVTCTTGSGGGSNNSGSGSGSYTRPRDNSKPPPKSYP